MNIKEYIESGIIELYAMDALSPEEKGEVEANIERYPELKSELDAVQEGLSLFAEIYAKEPDASLKQRVLGNLPFEVSNEVIGKPTVKIQDESPISKAPEPKVIKMQSKINLWLAAASVALLLTTSWLVLRNNQYSERIAELESRLSNSEQQFADLNTRFTANAEQLANLSSPDTKKILLSSKTQDVGANAVVFLNPKKAVMLISIDQLAELPEENQYQLWALVDGKPIDMGVLNNKKGMQSGKNIPELLQAQAFAITIEKKGGSPTPTLEKMVAAGAVS
ncbi:MAG: anti-sigma factor [Bacteroidia bacterium]